MRRLHRAVFSNYYRLEKIHNPTRTFKELSIFAEKLPRTTDSLRTSPDLNKHELTQNKLYKISWVFRNLAKCHGLPNIQDKVLLCPSHKISSKITVYSIFKRSNCDWNHKVSDLVHGWGFSSQSIYVIDLFFLSLFLPPSLSLSHS